jgi:hypothetical protein
MARNSQKRPRLPVTHPKRGKAHSTRQRKAELIAEPHVGKSKPADVSLVSTHPDHGITNGPGKPAPMRVPILEPRPADYPVGSLESRAAARALSLKMGDADPIRAVLAKIKRDPMTPAVVVPSAPAHGVGCSCGDCMLLTRVEPTQTERQVPAPSEQADRESLENVYDEAQRRANVLRAFQDVARAGGKGSPMPVPAWAAQR